MTQTKQGVTVVDFSKSLERIAGFFIGFIFQGLLAQKIIEAVQTSGGDIPAKIPMLTSFFIGGGIIGSILLIIVILLAIKFITRFMTFGAWLLIGILCAYLYVLFAPSLGIPNMFDWLSTTLNIK
jgi:hypothetical protein